MRLGTAPAALDTNHYIVHPPYRPQDLFVHDCIIGTIPIFCFSFHGPHGHSELHNSTLADAHCSDTAASPGIQFVLRVMLVAVNRGKAPVHLDSRWGCGPGRVRPGARGWVHHGCCHPATERGGRGSAANCCACFKCAQPNCATVSAPLKQRPHPAMHTCRRVWIEDSGVMATQETGGSWHFKNVTLMCTGTHSAHPARPWLQRLPQLLLSTPAALLVAALACIAAAAWWHTWPHGSGQAGAVGFAAGQACNCAAQILQCCLAVGQTTRGKLASPAALNCLPAPPAAAAPPLLPDNLPEVAAARERGILIAERIGRGALLPAGLGAPCE